MGYQQVSPSSVSSLPSFQEEGKEQRDEKARKPKVFRLGKEKQKGQEKNFSRKRRDFKAKK